MVQYLVHATCLSIILGHMTKPPNLRVKQITIPHHNLVMVHTQSVVYFIFEEQTVSVTMTMMGNTEVGGYL